MALHFDRAEFAARLDRLRAEMASRSLDAMLLFAQESMYWLTGYDTFGFCFFQSLVVTADGRMALLTRSADLRQARHTSIVEDIRIWKDAADANPAQDLRALLSGMGLAGARLGIEYDTHGLTAHNGRRLEAALSGFAEMCDASGVIDSLRLVKSAAEIEKTRIAARLADDSLDAALPLIHAGGGEAAILAAMQGAVFAGGGDYPANEFIIGSAEDALLCRYKAGRRTLSASDQITLEWAGVYHHYHAAMMRTVLVGQASARHVALFEAARDALVAVEAAMVPGRTFGDVFAAHEGAMAARGMAEHRLNACGYSVGARFTPSWMDRQMFYEANPLPIAPGMTLFAHMIIMDSSSGAAMCLGRTYLTTAGAPEPLSRHPLDLIVR